MADDTVLQVRIDKKTKDDVEKLYRSMGFTFASAVRLFAKQSLVEQGIPFKVTKTPTNTAGMLSKYADISKKELEEGAYESEIINKYKK